MSKFQLSTWPGKFGVGKNPRGKSYSEDEDSFIREKSNVMTAKQVAIALGRPVSGVYARAGFLGVSFTAGRKRWTDDETEFLIKNASTMTAKQIAEALGRTEYAVMERSRYIGGVMQKRGEKHHNNKYSDWDVEMCRKLHDEGLGPREISEKLDVNYSSVIDFIHHRTRKDS